MDIQRKLAAETSVEELCWSRRYEHIIKTFFTFVTKIISNGMMSLDKNAFVRILFNIFLVCLTPQKINSTLPWYVPISTFFKILDFFIHEKSKQVCKEGSLYRPDVVCPAF